MNQTLGNFNFGISKLGIFMGKFIESCYKIIKQKFPINKERWARLIIGLSLILIAGGFTYGLYITVLATLTFLSTLFIVGSMMSMYFDIKKHRKIIHNIPFIIGTTLFVIVSWFFLIDIYQMMVIGLSCGTLFVLLTIDLVSMGIRKMRGR